MRSEAMKKTLNYLAGAFALVWAFSAFAADDGDIYEFHPVTSGTVDKSLASPKTVTVMSCAT